MPHPVRHRDQDACCSPTSQPCRPAQAERLLRLSSACSTTPAGHPGSAGGARSPGTGSASRPITGCDTTRNGCWPATTFPPNVRFDYTPITEALPTIDLLLTMSSTACLEALDHGCRVGLILDLGVHERYGNHVFLDSGLLRTFSQLERDEIGEPRPEWLAGYFFDRPASAVEVIADRAEELLATGRRPSREAWASEYFASAAAFHRAIGVTNPTGPQPPVRLARPCIGGSTATGRSAAPSGTRSRRWSRRSSNVRCWPPPDPWPVRWPTTEMLSR